MFKIQGLWSKSISGVDPKVVKIKLFACTERTASKVWIVCDLIMNSCGMERELPRYSIWTNYSDWTQALSIVKAQTVQ